MSPSQICVTCLALVVAAEQAYAQASSASSQQRQEPPTGVRFEFKKPPSLTFGEAGRIDFRFKLHSDYRSFFPDLRREDRLDIRRARAGVEGEFFKVVQYEIEYDFREIDYPLRDAFVNVRANRALEIRAGKFKMPFGRETQTGAMNLDLAFRSRAADQLSPGRAVGAMAHGRGLNRRLQYQVGLFGQDGENARPKRLADPSAAVSDVVIEDSGWNDALTWAARTVYDIGRAGALRGVEVGAAFTSGNVPEGRNGLRGRMVFGGGFFPALEVNGRRQRVGLETAFRAGPVSVRAELIRVRDERRGQGFENEDLDPAIAQGWYLAGTWLAVGPKPGNADQPATRLGAIELAARYEGLRFGGKAVGDEASRSPRAAAIVPNSDRAMTLGVNWYVNRFIRVQANAIRERIEDAARTPIPAQQVYWGAILRFQFVL